MATVELSQTEPSVRKKMFGLPIDGMLIVVVGALVGFGLLMVYSTTFDWSYQAYDDAAYIFLRQVGWLGVGLIAMTTTALMPYRWWRRLAVLLMGITLLLLILVLLFGSTRFNAQRSFFNGSVQPSELAKFVTILYLAVWLDSKSDRLHQLGYGIGPFGIIVGVITALILAQPDLSAAATVVMIAAILFFVGGADILQMLIVAIAGTLTAVGVLQFYDTGRQRLSDYLAGVQDLTQASWHVQQAAIAFVNGGIFGRGLGESHQKFGFLPTPHTDSIFAIVGEELGLVGCVLLIGLFVALAWRGFRIAGGARDQLGALLAAGIVCWVTLEAIINTAVMVGILPFAGNALPFISYGGSSLVVNLSAMGVLLSISRREQRDEAIPRRTRNSGLLRRMLGQERTRLNATHDLGRRDRRGRVSRLVSRSDGHS
ncbi:MAG: cell division protein FtsW [Anaerolineales bacterium]|nr:cell division protein FtsW [Anaerolineales bacterium]